MKQLASIFKLSKEERRPALWFFVYLLWLEGMAVRYGWLRFAGVTTDIHEALVSRFHVSGFDAWTYEILTQWSPAYDIYRHPLIAFLLYPAYLLNQGLSWLFGSNLCMVLMAVVNLFCGGYALVFLLRILRQVMGLGTLDSNLLTFFFMSLGYILLTFSVPDHFCMSLMLLLLTLWISGRQLREGRPMRVVTAVWLFVLTAGVSLSNGLKTFLAACSSTAVASSACVFWPSASQCRPSCSDFSPWRSIRCSSSRASTHAWPPPKSTARSTAGSLRPASKTRCRRAIRPVWPRP